MRFRATVKKQGPNPYVDVPDRVSRALASHARAGRIGFEGTLSGAPIRGSLVPVGAGRHRLFVNGGMRAASGVRAGDKATFVIRATRPGEVPLPRDVAAALARRRGARAAFEKLSPSHRRELLRYVDDARTKETRARRIEKAAAHALGEGSREASRGHERPLWACPRCGNEFVNRNQRHSCRKFGLDDPFRGKPASVRALFDRFRAMVEKLGPVRVLPYADKVGFMVKVRFAGAIPRKRWLDVGFWLPRRIESPRVRRVETLSPEAHVHLVRLTDPSELDREFAGWLREAYAVGRREHLGRPRTPA